MGSPVNDRELVLETLLLITKEGEYSHIALKNVLDQYQYLDKKERAFITRVVNGTLERMIEIDYIINQFSKVKVNKMKPVIRTILRSSVYQLKYMDSVPDSAVCNEAVKLSVRKGFSNLKGFVNGVLRTISRNLSKVELPSMSVKYSLPQWMIDQWMESYDEETVARMGQAFLEEHPTTIRCNLNAISKEELIQELREEQVEVEETGLPYALRIRGYDYLNKLTSFQKGHFYVPASYKLFCHMNGFPSRRRTDIDHIISFFRICPFRHLHRAYVLHIEMSFLKTCRKRACRGERSYRI